MVLPSSGLGITLNIDKCLLGQLTLKMKVL
jgi:hypothetical protein